MSALFTVYDTHGEPFEVRPDVAKKLVIINGWSLDEPKAKAVVEAPVSPPVVAAETDLPVNHQSDETVPAPKPING